jgi:hypothetical protein
LRPETLSKVYARLVALADDAKTIEDHHVVAAIVAESVLSPEEARPCV